MAAKTKQEAGSSIYLNPREIELGNEFFGSEGRFNSRTVSNPGFAPEKMDGLRDAIKSDGLHSALVVRMDKKEKPILVAGERRLRVINQMIDDDEEAMRQIEAGAKDVKRIMVKNPRTKKMEPAYDVYCEYGVECKIADGLEEKDFVRQNVLENTLHEPLTDYELLLMCEKMERVNISRAEQAQTMGVSEAWISQSHQLLAAPECILKEMEKGTLRRTAALTFLDIETEKIPAVLKRTMQLTWQEAAEKEKQLLEEKEAALEEMQAGESATRYATYTGDHVGVKRGKRQVSRAGKKIDEVEKKLKNVSAKKNKKINAETIKAAAKDLNADEHIHKPQAMKNIRLLESEFVEILSKEEGKELSHPVSGDRFARRDIHLVQELFSWVLGQSDCNHPLDVILYVDGKKKKK